MKTVPDKAKAKIRETINSKIKDQVRAETIFQSVLEQSNLAQLISNNSDDSSESQLVKKCVRSMEVVFFDQLNSPDNETRIQAFTDFGMELGAAKKLTDTLHGCLITSDEFNGIKDEMSDDNELNALVVNKLNTFDSKSEF